VRKSSGYGAGKHNLEPVCEPAVGIGCMLVLTRVILSKEGEKKHIRTYKTVKRIHESLVDISGKLNGVVLPLENDLILGFLTEEELFEHHFPTLKLNMIVVVLLILAKLDGEAGGLVLARRVKTELKPPVKINLVDRARSDHLLEEPDGRKEIAFPGTVSAIDGCKAEGGGVGTASFVLLMAMALAGREGVELGRILERVDVFGDEAKEHSWIPLKVHGKGTKIIRIIQYIGENTDRF